MNRLVGPDRRECGRKASRIARLDEEAGPADDLGQGADRARHDRRSGRQRLQGRQAGGRADDRQDDGPGSRDERGETARGQVRRVREQLADAVARGRPRDRGPVLRGGIDEEDLWRPRHVRPERARPARRGEIGQGAQERRQVLAGIVPAGIDEVAVRQAEPCPLLGRTGSGRGDERRAGGERDDPDPLAPQTEVTAGRSAGSLPGDDDGRGVPEDPCSEALTEAGCRCPLVCARQLPGRQIEERHDDRQPRGERHRPARGVVDGPGRTAAGRAPAGPDRGAAQEERVGRQCGRAQQAGRRERSPAGDRKTRQIVELLGRIRQAGLDEDRERLAGDRVGGERPQELLEVDRGRGRALGLLERPDVEHDAGATERAGGRAALAKARPYHRPRPIIGRPRGRRRDRQPRTAAGALPSAASARRGAPRR